MMGLMQQAQAATGVQQPYLTVQPLVLGTGEATSAFVVPPHAPLMSDLTLLAPVSATHAQPATGPRDVVAVAAAATGAGASARAGPSASAAPPLVASAGAWLTPTADAWLTPTADAWLTPTADAWQPGGGGGGLQQFGGADEDGLTHAEKRRLKRLQKQMGALAATPVDSGSLPSDAAAIAPAEAAATKSATTKTSGSGADVAAIAPHVSSADATAGGPTALGSSAPAVTESEEVEALRRQMRKATKKLREIEAVEEKVAAAGASIDEAQGRKIAQKPDVAATVAKLAAQLAALGALPER